MVVTGGDNGAHIHIQQCIVKWKAWHLDEKSVFCNKNLKNFSQLSLPQRFCKESLPSFYQKVKVKEASKEFKCHKKN